MGAEAASTARLWWSRIGKWQALMVVVTLAVFFATLGITGDKATAAFAAAFVTFAAAIVAAAIAAFAAAALVAAAIAVVAVAIVNETPRVGKKVVWLSYMGELLLILLPMVWVLRG